MTDPADDLAQDFARTAEQVTSGPPCRICLQPMEPGMLVFSSGQPITSRLDWHDPGPNPASLGPAVETLVWGPGREYHGLLGFRCPECKHLELAYGKNAAPFPAAPTKPGS